jgi:hypothetical protein
MTTLQFSFDESGETATLTKAALLFTSGNHRSKNGQSHSFPKERVQKIAENTNKSMEEGVTIPFQLNHSKLAEDTIGELTGPVFTKVITQEDLPNPRAKNLIGRLGIFTKNLTARGSEVVQKLKDGVIKSLSIGVDPLTEAMIEVSSVAFPAIAGCATFGKSGLSEVLEFSELIPEGSEMDSPEGQKAPILDMYAALGIEKQATKIHEEYEKLSNALGKVLSNIYTASEEILKGKNPVEESYAALDYFNQEVEMLFELVEEENTEEPELPTTVNQTDRDRRKANFSKPNKKSHINFSQR